MREKYSLNLGWYFKPSFNAVEKVAPALDTYEPVNLPHTVKELSYNCFSHAETAMLSSYVRKLTLPESAAGKRAILEFMGVMARYELYVNYSRSRVDITKYLHEGENLLFMLVDSTENDEIPPFGKTIDYMCFGGIYRDVNLLVTDAAYIEDVMFRYDLNGTTAELYPEIRLNNAGEAFDGYHP